VEYVFMRTILPGRVGHPLSVRKESRIFLTADRADGADGRIAADGSFHSIRVICVIRGFRFPLAQRAFRG
jgi:hypothetical protein